MRFFIAKPRAIQDFAKAGMDLQTYKQDGDSAIQDTDWDLVISNIRSPKAHQELCQEGRWSSQSIGVFLGASLLSNSLVVSHHQTTHHHKMRVEEIDNCAWQSSKVKPRKCIACRLNCNLERGWLHMQPSHEQVQVNTLKWTGTGTITNLI